MYNIIQIFYINTYNYLLNICILFKHCLKQSFPTTGSRPKVLGKMCIDITLCYLLCINDFSNYSAFALYAIDIE